MCKDKTSIIISMTYPKNVIILNIMWENPAVNCCVYVQFNPQTWCYEFMNSVGLKIQTYGKKFGLDGYWSSEHD